jgi:hypothetical protein
MTDSKLPLTIHLTKRAPKRRVIEKRIIPKTSRAASLMQKFPLHLAAKSSHHFPALSQSNHTNKSSRAFRTPAKPLQDQPIISLIGSVLTRIPSRVNTRLAAKRIHSKPRIIGKQQTRREMAVVSSLKSGIFLKRSASFLGSRNRPQIGQRLYVHVQ